MARYPRYQSERERFWSKVNLNGPVPAYLPGLGPCWLWTAGAQRSNGGHYGTFSRARTRTPIKAHRFAWEHEYGALPPATQLDHLCRVTLCVNPRHLEPVTVRENILRGTNPAAVHARKTHCIHGHPLSGVNSYIAGASGQRMCRTCRRLWGRERKARIKQRSPDHSNASKTACKHGHAFTPENTYPAPDGSRHCRTCGRERANAAYQRRRA